MVANKSTFENLIIYVAVISLVLLMAALAVAQSPGAPVDKPAAEASQVQLESGKTLAITSEEQTTTGAAADTTRPETKNSKTKVDRTAPSTVTPTPLPPQCQRKITADVVAIAQPIMLNRLGAAIPNGMIFALRRDTIKVGNQVQLRADKRPRPIALRANVGDCLTIK